MVTKIYSMENLGCASCAAKMEAQFNKMAQVEHAAITFATGLLQVTAEDPDALLPELERIARSYESEVRIVPRDSGCDHHAHNHCACGHCHHEHDHDHCACGHDCHDRERHAPSASHSHEHSHQGGELSVLLLGGGLFLAGVILSQLGGTVWTAVSMGAFILAYGLLGWPVLKEAGRNFFRGHVFDENFLMSIATLGAFAIGEFPEAVGVMLFYRIGEYFEEKAVARSRSQIMAAADLRPDTVNLLEEKELRIIPAGQARVGDVLLVRPGDRIPLDGVVLTGESPIDTAPITGEPVPVRVGPGDRVISGCVNTTGQLTIQVEHPLSESMVTRILNSVESAAASKPKIDRFITRFARIYTPIVVLIALLTAVIPSLITGNWGHWIYTALSFLVMSCPCALVLSVPLAFFAGIGAGSKKGILFKGGLSMEAMSRIRAVVMDKTGTLTQGNFRVSRLLGDAGLLRLCASCEQQSTHPIAVSITAAAREQGLSLSAPEELEELPGRGIRAVVEGSTLLCGSRLLLQEQGVAIPEGEEPDGTLVYAARDGQYLGMLVISDTLKEDAAQAVSDLNRRGYFTVMLTGDTVQGARNVAEQTGVSRFYARLLPQEKLEKMQQLREEAGSVMFVGDGINDAPVLAGADVGAAMGSGADAALEAADVVFVTNRVSAIGEALQIAERTNGVAWQNVIFALSVKLAVMVLGLLGFASMWLAVFADSGVAMLCVLNSIRTLYRKK